MRSETIWVKKPVSVRIVNPDPIRILDMDWRYGDHVRLKPGGVIRTLSHSDGRTLAICQPPHPPSELAEAPPDALVLYTPEELRMLATGALNFPDPYDLPMPRAAPRGPALLTRLGECAGVPRSRTVKATPPHAVQESRRGGPFREERCVEYLNRLPEWTTIRPGGTMTVFTFCGDAPEQLLKVRYRANPHHRGEQCETGMWFYVPEAEFIRMRDEARKIQELETAERRTVIRMLMDVR